MVSNLNLHNSTESILLLKEKAADLIAVLMRQCPSRSDLQTECSNLLLKAISQDEVHELTLVGSLLALSRMGPELAIKSVVKNINIIMN
jgi:hypothetical protein